MTLATSDHELIEDMLASMGENRDLIETDVNQLVYHMNGGLDYDDAWLLSSDQRVRMSETIIKNLEARYGSKQSGNL